MASSIACSTTDLSMDLSRATASAICKSSVLLAAIAAMICVSRSRARFARLQVFFNQPVGKHEFGFGDAAVRKCKSPTFDFDDDAAAVQAQQQTLETLSPAGIWRHEFDFRFVPGPAREINEARQRPIDPRR